KRPPAQEVADGGASSHSAAPVDLDAIDRERGLHGVVVDADGRAVAGANVSVRLPPWHRTTAAGCGGWPESATTTSRTDGRFAVRLLPGQLAYLRVSAEG